MKTNNADSPKIQLKPPALPVSYERITKPPTWVLASERRKPLPKRRHADLLLIDEAADRRGQSPCSTGVAAG